jgi:hypothetical protein
MDIRKDVAARALSFPRRFHQAKLDAWGLSSDAIFGPQPFQQRNIVLGNLRPGAIEKSAIRPT